MLSWLFFFYKLIWRSFLCLNMLNLSLFVCLDGWTIHAPFLNIYVIVNNHEWGCSQTPGQWNKTGNCKHSATLEHTKDWRKQQIERSLLKKKSFPLKSSLKRTRLKLIKVSAHTFPAANSRSGLGGSRFGRVSQASSSPATPPHPQWITSLTRRKGLCVPSLEPLVWVSQGNVVSGEVLTERTPRCWSTWCKRPGVESRPIGLGMMARNGAKMCFCLNLCCVCVVLPCLLLKLHNIHRWNAKETPRNMKSDTESHPQASKWCHILWSLIYISAILHQIFIFVCLIIINFWAFEITSNFSPFPIVFIKAIIFRCKWNSMTDILRRTLNVQQRRACLTTREQLSLSPVGNTGENNVRNA